MIHAEYVEYEQRDGNVMRRLEVYGHACHEAKGKDIVCAGASMLMETLVYQLADCEKAECSAYREPTGPRVSVKMKGCASPSDVAALEFVKAGLALLAERYPANVCYQDKSREGQERMVDLQLFAATATTAASGGSREELLGQRPAGCKQSEADAGSRNPAGGFDLQLFAEGGDAGAPAGDGSPAAEGAGSMEPPMRPAEEKLARCSGVLKRTGKANLSGATQTALPQSAGPAGPLSHAARDSSPTKGSHWQDGGQYQTAQAQSGANGQALLPTEESAEEQGQFSTEEGEERGEQAQRTPEERRKAFHAMLQGEYRAETEELMNQAVERAAQLLENSPPVRNLMNALSEAYGIDPNDLDALTEAVKNGQVKDEAYYEKLAMEKGISVATARQMDKLESENRRLSAAERFAEDQRKAAQRQAEIAQIHAAWDREAEQLKAQYPDFDLEATLANPEVGDLMRRGVSMSNAYRAVYFDQIMAQNESRTAKQVADGVTERIRQRGARPSENGTRPGGAAQTHTDVNALTRKEREQLERAALRGQVITF